MKRREYVEYIEGKQYVSDISDGDIIEYWQHFNEEDDEKRARILSANTLRLLGIAMNRFREKAAQLLSEGKSTKWVDGSMLVPKKINKELREKWDKYIPLNTTTEMCKMAINKILGMKVFEINEGV